LLRPRLRAGAKWNTHACEINEGPRSVRDQQLWRQIWRVEVQNLDVKK
jgi:hypothetical protein